MRHERTKIRLFFVAIALIIVFLLGNWIMDQPNASASTVCVGSSSGGLNVNPVCGDKATRKDYKITVKNGKASIPSLVPERVKKVIRAANKISHRPYVYGGGHGSFISHGYDCSGSVSYALRAGGFVKSPMASGPFMSWGKPGKGKWITIYANSGHMFMEVAGATFDTSGANPSRWQREIKSKNGYTARRPASL